MAYGAAAAAHAAMVRAVKASGVLVKVTPGDFSVITGKTRNPLVVTARTGWRGQNYAYLTSYKGLAFHTEAQRPIDLPADAEIIDAQRIWMPS